MVMEPNQQVDGSQNKSDFSQDVMEFQQHGAHVDSNTGPKGHLKLDNADIKSFQQNSNGPEAEQFKTVPPSRPFGSGYNDGLQRPPAMYPDSMMPPSIEQTHYQQSGAMAPSNNITSLAANTPTLNQLLTQNPTPQKYPPGYGDYSNANSGPPSGAPGMYDNWNSTQQQTSMSSHVARPGMPLPNRPMGATSAQMTSSMYDRGGMHQNYRHPNAPFGPPGASGYPRMMGPHQGYPGMEANQAASGGEAGEMDASQQRIRPMMAPQRTMGPPRAPGPHQVEPGGQMMPPPNQNQVYPGMYPYGSQPYRNTQMSPYTNYPTNQMSPQMSRISQPGFTQGPINPQHQVNGPHKPVAQATNQSLTQPMTQPSPGGSAMRGISPGPNQQASLAGSPAGPVTGKTLSPCPSPSVRSMPVSPAAQLNSPRPGLSPRPESVSSPRTDSGSVKPETVATSVASGGQNVNQPHVNSSNQSDQSQSHLKSELQHAAVHGSQPQPMQHMMPPQQMRMLPSGGSITPHQQGPAIGNGMPPYGQRMPLLAQTPNQYQQNNASYPPGTPQYPPNHNQQMAYAANPTAPPGPQGAWQQSQQMPTDVQRMPNSGGIYAMKNDKGPVPSPLSSTQSPSAVASPHGSEGRRPSSRKSSDAGSHKSQKPSAPNSVHGTSQDIVNKQVDMGPASEAPQRRQFFEHLCAFYQETAKPLSSNPSIGKNALDLYKVYTLVKEKGGFQQVCKKKLWKMVGSTVAVSTAANAAYTLKKAYMKFLLNYECKFELGGADPQTIINSVETKKERQNRNAPSPAGSGNSQEAHMRGYPDYPMVPGGVPSQVHPAHMPGGQMRPGQYHADPSMTPHPQHGYMNYNSMPGAVPAGMPNGHHPMPPHQSGPMGTEEQQTMHSQGDSSADHYHQQINSNQYNNNQQMGAPGYPPRHPYYGPRMPPPGAQRPPYHPQQSSGAGPQQQPGGLPASQMRMSHQQPSGYPPMYRETNSYPNSQSGMGPSSSTNPGGFPSIGGQPNMSAVSASPAFPQSSVVGANLSQISATPNNMVQPSLHSSPSTPMPRYSSHRPPYQTPTRGALSAMLSNSASASGLDTHLLSLPSFTDSLNHGSGSITSALEMPPPRMPFAEHSRLGSLHEMRMAPGQQWRQRAPMPPPGYTHAPSNEPMSRRQLPMARPGPAPKRDVVFPPGTVESTQMNKMQRRVLHSKHTGKVDSSRLIMCLRSGLLCESVWALDSITIYLQDDNTSVYFTLSKMPALYDAIIAYYKQSLAAMFEELSDLVESGSRSRTQSTDSTHSADECEGSEKGQVMLDETNYSWSARNGMKVIVDSEPKIGPTTPTPFVYSQVAYTSHRTDHTVISTHESGNNKEFYTKHFRHNLSAEMCPSSNSSVHKDGCRSPTNSQTSSSTAPAADASQPVQAGKQQLSEDKVTQYGGCNGFLSFGLEPELVSEQSCESSDTALPSKVTETHSEVKGESSIDRKVAESEDNLKALEVKLSHSRKRRFSETIDVEPIIRDEPPLESEVDMKLEEISIRCLTLANILRGFSFVPNNEKVMAETTELLYIMGRLLNVKTQVDVRQEKRWWWWSTLETLREHTLVTLSNIAGYVQLIGVSHEVCYPLLDSLLFWATTNAAYARDPLPCTHSLCIRNLVMEILCKMCAHCENMNLLLSTPPHDRITSLFQCLAKLLSEPDQVRREFALVTVSCLAQADAAAARGLAVQTSCVSQLIGILESAESAALSIAQQRGVSALRDKPEAMGTSLDMIRRTSATLVEMAQVEANHSILLRQQDRLLNLVMSQILDQHVAKMLSDVLYECTKHSQVEIAPSYIISTELPTENKGGKAELDTSVEEEPAEQAVEKDCKGVLKTKEERQLGKENINQSSLETNSTMEMISAAS